MSITEKEKVDLVATLPGTRLVKLVITDHLDWDDFETHCRLLQDKINTYLEFIESGQINRLPNHSIPASPDIRITLAVPRPPTPEAQEFLVRVKEFLRGVGVGFETEIRGAHIVTP